MKSNEGVTGSSGDTPTGYIYSRPIDVLRNKYGPGNPESVRQLSLRAREAEERLNRYRSEVEVLKMQNVNFKKQLDDIKEMKLKMMTEYEERETRLLEQINEIKKQESQSRFDQLLAIFHSSAELPKSYEPPYAVSVKAYSVDAETCTDECFGLNLRKDVAQCDASTAPASERNQFVSVSCEALIEDKKALELEKFLLETQLKLAKTKTDHYDMLEAQKKNLEDRNVALSNINDQLIKEVERLKEMLASNLEEKGESLLKSRNLVELNLEYQFKIDEKNAEIVLKTKKLEELSEIHNNVLAELKSLKEEYKILEEKSDMSTSAGTSSDALSKEVMQKYEDEITTLKEKLSKYEPESYSDTTKILHYRFNPLDIAHKEYKEFEANRKRKQEVSLLCDPEELDVSARKRQHTDLVKQINDLQFQLHKSDKEKERALKIQSDLVKKYRAIVTALSGWQIKMKDEGFVQVESIFKPGNFFVFKVEDWGKAISLMETDYAKEWPQQFEKYLKGRNSTPAFLAAVTLELDEYSDSSHWSFTINRSD